MGTIILLTMIKEILKMYHESLWYTDWQGLPKLGYAHTACKICISSQVTRLYVKFH